ncbi:hypothetical protein Tco_0915318, partial [Tanacetum coccineum]
DSESNDQHVAPIVTIVPRRNVESRIQALDEEVKHLAMSFDFYLEFIQERDEQRWFREWSSVMMSNILEQ